MDQIDFGWLSPISEFLRPLLDTLWALLSRLGHWFSDLQARYPQVFSPQTLFGLIGASLAIWRWWEGREANLFRKFEEMIARNEAQLVKAQNDLLDVMIRPGPGLRIRPPLFIEKALRLVLLRRRWHPSSLARVGGRISRRLDQAIETSNRKVLAHQARLSFYRQEVASARLLQGAVAAAGAAGATDIADRQRLEQEALERFRAVLVIPGHKEDLPALELIAHQLAQMDRQSSAAAIAYETAIQVLNHRPASPRRNLMLARVKRNLAILRYPRSPGVACRLLADTASLLTEFGPRRDRDLLELADALTLEGLARFRLGMVAIGPLRLNEGHGHYNDLLRSLRARRKGLFDWMFRTRLYAGHRVKELHHRALLGLAFNEHVINLTDRYPHTMTLNLQRGHGERRRNRKPLPLPKGH